MVRQSTLDTFSVMTVSWAATCRTSWLQLTSLCRGVVVVLG